MSNEVTANDKVEVYGTTYPMRITMGAMLRFKRETGLDVSQIGQDISLLVIFLYCCVASTCNADNHSFDLELEKFADGLSIEALNSFAANLKGNPEETKKKTRK